MASERLYFAKSFCSLGSSYIAAPCFQPYLKLERTRGPPSRLMKRVFMAPRPFVIYLDSRVSGGTVRCTLMRSTRQSAESEKKERRSTTPCVFIGLMIGLPTK